MSLIKSFSKRLRDRILTPRGIRHITGPEIVHLAPEEVVVLCLCRDEEYLISEFLTHYRNLGVKHFVFLDNGSVDRTREIISEQEDCTLLISNLPYRVYKTHMKRYLIRRFSRDRWSLLADADEFFEYPYSDTVPLTSFISYLDRHGYTAVYTPLLDMFSSRPVGEWEVMEKLPFSREDYPFYDLPDVLDKPSELDTHRRCQVTNKAIRLFAGGVRNRVFGTKNTFTKHALTRCCGGKVLMHTDHAVRGAVIADTSGVLFHYKLSGSFMRKTAKYAEEGNYWNDSAWLKLYLKRIREETGLSLMGPYTKKLVSADDLIELGFIFVSRQYLDELISHHL